jgi:hypothetical protein
MGRHMRLVKELFDIYISGSFFLKWIYIRFMQACKTFTPLILETAVFFSGDPSSYPSCIEHTYATTSLLLGRHKFSEPAACCAFGCSLPCACLLLALAGGMTSISLQLTLLKYKCIA